MTDIVDPSKINIRQISKSIAEKMIVSNHYTHKWTQCTVALGIFVSGREENEFFHDDETLVGCLIYGNPVGRSASTSISTNLKHEEVLELTRLWVEEGTGKNTESFVISQSFKWIKSNMPNIKCVLSYADDELHIGKIYQATNFIFMGRTGEMNLMPNFSISLTKDPYKWIHSRSVFSKFGSHNVEHLKRCIGQTFWRKKEASKFKYVYFLCNKKEKIEFIKNLKQKPKPYPKENVFVEEIQEILVDKISKQNELFI